MASTTWLQHAAARTTMRRRAGQRPHDETRSWLLPFSTAADLRGFCAAETLRRLDYAVSEKASIVRERTSRLAHRARWPLAERKRHVFRRKAEETSNLA